MRQKKQYTEYLPLNSLSINDRVQRGLIPARSKALQKKWNFRDVGVLTISRRDGKNWIVNGQHRWDAGMSLGYGESKVLCHIYTDLSEQEEAEVFLALNDVRSVSPYERYRIGLIANDPVYCGIEAILAKHGLHITPNTSEGGIRCIAKIEQIYKRDPADLDRLCKIILEAWGTRAAAFEQVVIAGLGHVISRYNGELDDATCSKKLAKYRGGPAALSGDARGWSDYKPISVSRAVAEIIVDTYNKGRRSGQLSPL